MESTDIVQGEDSSLQRNPVWIKRIDFQQNEYE